MSEIPVVSIVGRTNVGKSTLFNRLIGRRKSIVVEINGTTRDRIEENVKIYGSEFKLVDMGGIKNDVDKLDRQIYGEIKRADLILFVVDGKDGVLPYDKEVSFLLQREKKKVILVVNKIDNDKLEEKIIEFYELGFEPISCSAISGRNIGDLLEEIIKNLPKTEERQEVKKENIKVAIVGKPNVGKSSILNAILKENRVLVDEKPGTTRDAIDVNFSFNKYNFIFIDTAGLRKRKKIKDEIEYYSIKRALRAIDSSDVVLLIVDATDGVKNQEKKIAEYIMKKYKAIIIIVNKWDLLLENLKISKKEYVNLIKNKLKFLNFAPILFTSCKTSEGIDKILNLVISTYSQYKKRIETSILNNVINNAIKQHQISLLKIYYITQVKVKPPTFILFVNNPKNLHFSYKRYLENNIRKKFGFSGTPLKMILRRK